MVAATRSIGGATSGGGDGARGGSGADVGAGTQAPSKITLMARTANINRFISVFLIPQYLDKLHQNKEGTSHRHIS